jgi:hypothetical protein
MTVALDALQDVLQDENILLVWSDIRKAVIRTCIAFRKPERFPVLVLQKIAVLLGIDSKTA